MRVSAVLDPSSLLSLQDWLIGGSTSFFSVFSADPQVPLRLVLSSFQENIMVFSE
ncbi:hypothetical protein AM1_0139 [Acaryochloris marina MBIC11017]|uniref:Uncharacterized protein n=1 Tax=Acaryochloris marina (strain MBIC 11017) TaxID=329726 RepID=B0C6D1_ACAM1|nr:hypothetical protein AM1_0139 [Acaryochloris marina MBIC11017]